MKILYIEANMGASGDMLLSSLYGLLSDDKKVIFKEKLNNINLKKVKFNIDNVIVGNVTGYRSSVLVNNVEEESVDVSIKEEKVKKFENSFFSKNPRYKKVDITNSINDYNEKSHSHEHKDEDKDLNQGEDFHHNTHSHNHSHSHNGLREVNSIINSLNIDEKIKKQANEIYNIIGEAEAKVHGKTMDEVHFHEVGEYDAIFDIVSVCILFDMLGVNKIITSSINLGHGFVKCAHGILPVPAPATALIIEGMMTHSSKINGELLTPTGAALLKYFTHEYNTMPQMIINKSSFGFGKKTFEVLNALRCYLGTITDNYNDYNKLNDNKKYKVTDKYEIDEEVGYKNQEFEEVYEVKTNIDDMTGEELSTIIDDLLKAGSLDAYISQVLMKKSRMGGLIVALCKKDKLNQIMNVLLKNTSTLGVRFSKFYRNKLNREIKEFEVLGHRVNIKHSHNGELGISKYKVEFDDILKVSRDLNISFKEARELIIKNLKL